jgi:hypothetical protein
VENATYLIGRSVTHTHEKAQEGKYHDTSIRTVFGCSMCSYILTCWFLLCSDVRNSAVNVKRSADTESTDIYFVDYHDTLYIFLLPCFLPPFLIMDLSFQQSWDILDQRGTLPPQHSDLLQDCSSPSGRTRNSAADTRRLN